MQDRSPMMSEQADKQDIEAVLYRHCRSVDRNDIEGLRESFHEGAILQLGYFNGPLESYLMRFEQMANRTAPSISSLQHRLCNILSIVNGNRARTESYIDVRRRVIEDGAPVDEIIASRALDMFERRSGRWAIVHRTIVWDWSMKVSATQAQWEGQPDYLVGSRDSNDPSHSFWRDAW